MRVVLPVLKDKERCARNFLVQGHLPEGNFREITNPPPNPPIISEVSFVIVVVLRACPLRRILLQPKIRDIIDNDHNPAYQNKEASNRFHVNSKYQKNRPYLHIPDGSG